jgi:hypothetical protein
MVNVPCRLCKRMGKSETCTVCNGAGRINANELDRWTFADLDATIGPGAVDAKPRHSAGIVKNGVWVTYMDTRGYLQSEFRKPADVAAPLPNGAVPMSPEEAFK